MLGALLPIDHRHAAFAIACRSRDAGAGLEVQGASALKAGFADMEPASIRRLELETIDTVVVGFLNGASVSAPAPWFGGWSGRRPHGTWASCSGRSPPTTTRKRRLGSPMT